MGIDTAEAYPSKYLVAADLKGQSVRVFIDRAEWGTMKDQTRKIIVYFQGKQKGMALNKTNLRSIAAAYGQNTDSWTGAEVELFPIMTEYQGNMVPALRVRVPPARQPTQVPPQQRAPVPPPQAQAPAGAEQPKDFDDDIPF